MESAAISSSGRSPCGPVTMPLTLLRRLIRPVAGDLDLGAILRAEGLSPDLLDDAAEAEVRVSHYLRIRERVAEQLRDETCHLSARHLLPGSTALVLSQLPARGTLEEAMRRVAAAYNLLHGGDYNAVAREGGAAVFAIDDRGFPYTLRNEEYVAFLMECALLFVHVLFCRISPPAGQGLLRIAVRRKHSPLLPLSDIVGVPVETGAERYALSYPLEAATRCSAYPPAERMARQAVTEELCALLDRAAGGPAEGGERITGAVEALLHEGVTDQAAICARLGLSPATLRRRLAAEASNFRILRRNALDRRARVLLATELPLPEISSRLGFSDVRAFNRAFKSWNGITPKTQRSEAAGEGAGVS